MMSDFQGLKNKFDQIAVEGYVGDLKGELAYAYLRVSSNEQAEEGTSGLPRQLERIHEVATRDGYKIPWNHVFTDDASGFEFEERPALSELRMEFKSNKRRADVVIIEDIDRLSRNAIWHQGFLLEEMKRYSILVKFWKQYNSEIERTVMGIVAQEGMQQAKQRMMQGNLHKARDGRVTARTAAYGYKIVDADGNESPAAKKFSYYAINNDEAEVIRFIFRRVANGDTLRRIASELTETGVHPPKKAKFWESTQIRLFIRNEVYRGDFYAHRWLHTYEYKESPDGFSKRKVYKRVERPHDEWIRVEVPAIVSVEEWEAANRMLDQNRKMSRRNASEPYLLTGLIRCNCCGYTYTGLTHKKVRGQLRETPYRGYRCPNSSSRPLHVVKYINCKNGYISAKYIENAVWSIICDVLLNPDTLIEALEAQAKASGIEQFEEQIAFLEKELANNTIKDEKLQRAYFAGAYSEQELAEMRTKFKQESNLLQEQMQQVKARMITREQLAEQKVEVVAWVNEMKRLNIPIEPNFERKQRIIKMLIDIIVLDTREGLFSIEGAICKTVPIENIHVRAATLATRSKPVPALLR